MKRKIWDDSFLDMPEHRLALLANRKNRTPSAAATKMTGGSGVSNAMMRVRQENYARRLFRASSRRVDGYSTNSNSAVPRSCHLARSLLDPTGHASSARCNIVSGMLDAHRPSRSIADRLPGATDLQPAARGERTPAAATLDCSALTLVSRCDIALEQARARLGDSKPAGSAGCEEQQLSMGVMRMSIDNNDDDEAHVENYMPRLNNPPSMVGSYLAHPGGAVDTPFASRPAKLRSGGDKSSGRDTADH